MDTEKRTLGDRQRRTPLIPQNVEADAAVRVDVGVVDPGGKADFGRLERIIGRELNVEEENAAGVGGVGRAHNGRLPVELFNRACQYAGSRARCHGSIHGKGHDAMPGIEPCLSKKRGGLSIQDLHPEGQQSKRRAGRYRQQQHVSIISDSRYGMHLWRLRKRLETARGSAAATAAA